MAETPQPIAEIDHGPSKFEQFMDNHQSKLIIGAIIIALGVIGYVIWSGLEKGKQQAAGSALVQADEVADYRDVIEKHQGSKAAASAMPLLADLQWQDSQPDAIQTLQDFITNHPEHPAMLTAKVSLGLRLLEQGKQDEAESTLSEVAESYNDSYLGPLASIALGDLAKMRGNTDLAKDWYEKASVSSGEQVNTFKNMAIDRLSTVSAKPPIKIKPAPPKPPEKPSETPKEDQPEAPAESNTTTETGAETEKTEAPEPPAQTPENDTKPGENQENKSPESDKSSTEPKKPEPTV